MNRPATFDAAKATPAPGERIRARAAHASRRLREAAERGVPSATRALRIANGIDERLYREDQQPILNGPDADLAAVNYYLRDYQFAIENICAEPSSDSWLDEWRPARVTRGMAA